jgi:hypothetical protein
VWALDLTSFKWFKQSCGGTVPRPRDKASATVCAGMMVVFGGHTQGKRLNDLCVLDLGSFAWSSWTSVMGQPSPREDAALCVGHGNLLFLHGGASNFGLDDLWVYALCASPCSRPAARYQVLDCPQTGSRATVRLLQQAEPRGPSLSTLCSMHCPSCEVCLALHCPPVYHYRACIRH